MLLNALRSRSSSFLADQSYQDTLPTLQYAQAARNIKNQVRINMDDTANIIAGLRDEIARLRNKIAKNPDSSNKEDVLKMEVVLSSWCSKCW